MLAERLYEVVAPRDQFSVASKALAFYAAFRQNALGSPSVGGIGIGYRINNARDPGVGYGIGTGTDPSCPRTRLQRDINRLAFKPGGAG
jgi:hypothetical protein